jgi:hypothetical protein
VQLRVPGAEAAQPGPGQGDRAAVGAQPIEVHVAVHGHRAAIDHRFVPGTAQLAVQREPAADDRTGHPDRAFHRGPFIQPEQRADPRVGQIQRNAVRRAEHTLRADGHAAHLAHRHVDAPGHFAPSGQHHFRAHRQPGRIQCGASRGWPLVNAAGLADRTGLDDGVTDDEPAGQPGTGHSEPAEDFRLSAGQVIDHEDAAADDRTLEVESRPIRRLDLRGREVE